MVLFSDWAWGDMCKRIIRKHNADACLGIGFDNIDRGGLGRDILRVRGLGVNEINWENIWKWRIDRNVEQKAVSLGEEAMESKPTLRGYKDKPKVVL